MIRGILVVLALVTSFMLAACNAIPDAGPVREGLSSLDQGERVVILNPSGPTEGSDQESIVLGFVRAAGSSANNYAIAREFLAPAYAEQWDPWLGTLVVEGSQQFQNPRRGVATLSLDVVANVDAGGTLVPSEPGGKTDVQFELVEVGGEWRISSAPAGIILDRSTFNAVWTATNLYFLTADDRLVADTRWFLNRQTLSTQIVQGLITGPAESMVGAIHTAFPTGVLLVSGAVPVLDGVARIDVTSELFEAGEVLLDQIKRQIVQSLQSVQGVTAYELSVNGSVIAEGVVMSTEELSGTDQESVFVMQGGEFGVATLEGVQPLPEISQRVSELEPTAATIALDRTSAVVQSQSGATWVSSNDTINVDERRSLLTPSLDPLGYVWLYSPSSPGELVVTSPDEQGGVFSVPWLENREAAAVRVSMGGNRIAALVRQDEGSAVYVAGIIRDSSGQPIGLTETAGVELWEEGAPIDLDWISDSRFAALTQTGLLGGSSRVTIGIVGQFASDSGSVAGGESISGGGRLPLLRVLDDQGRMFGPQGQGWQQLLSDVEFVSKVG